MANREFARGAECAFDALRLVLQSAEASNLDEMLARAREMVLLAAGGEDDPQPGSDRAAIERFAELSPDLFCILGKGGGPVAANAAWKSLLGYSLEDLIERGAAFSVHRKDVPQLREGLKRSMETGESPEVRVRHFAADGSTVYWIGWRAVRDPDSGFIYAIGRDVTEEMAASQVQEQLVAVLHETSQLLSEQAAELDNLRERAERLASFDGLTGVLNRRAWFAEAVGLRPTALAFLDLDRFKQMNDRFGHPAGDAILVEVARRMKETIGDAGIVGRIGGEEFGVLFHIPLAAATRLCRAIVKEIAASPVEITGSMTVSVTISAGLSAWLVTGATREHSLAATYDAADRALYRAKEAGRNQLVIEPVPESSAA